MDSTESTVIVMADDASEAVYPDEDEAQTDIDPQSQEEQLDITTTTAINDNEEMKVLQTYREQGKITLKGLASLYKPLFVEGDDQNKVSQFLRDEFDLEISPDRGTSTDDVLNTMNQVGRILFNLVGKRFLVLYNLYKDSQTDAEGGCLVGDIAEECLNEPTSHLIIWAVLLDKVDTLQELLRLSSFPIALSLVSAVVYRNLVELVGKDDKQLSANCRIKARSFEKFACELTESISRLDRDVAICTVGECMDLFGKNQRETATRRTLVISPAEISLEENMRDFISCAVTKSYTHRVFCNEIEVYRRYWLFLPLFWLPPLPVLLARPWRILKYNTGKYLDTTVDDRENSGVPNCLFFNMMEGISPMPKSSLHGVWRQKSSCCRKYFIADYLYSYYTAPVVVFQYYLISHLCLLVVFTHTVIHDMSLEWLVGVWFVAFILTDVHQMLTNSSGNALGSISGQERRNILQTGSWSLPEKANILSDCRLVHVLWNWFKDEWHVLDLAMYALFFAGLEAHHASSASQGLARAFYASAILFAYAKLLRFCVLWKTVATNAIRILLIAKKLLPLFLILLIVAVGFGVAYLAVLLPQPDHMQSPEQNVYMIFFRPFWHIFGDLQLNDMHLEMKAAAKNSCAEEEFNMWDPAKWTQCYTGWMAPILSAVFIFIANLVLFTYIIGLVSHYYGKTKAKTNTIWSSEVAKLVAWSGQLPLPPPPLNLIWCAVRLLLSLVLLVYIGCLWILRKRRRYERPEELMVNYPGCFTAYINILWVLSWFYKTRQSNYTRPLLEKRPLIKRAMDDMDLRRIFEHLKSTTGNTGK